MKTVALHPRPLPAAPAPARGSQTEPWPDTHPREPRRDHTDHPQGRGG